MSFPCSCGSSSDLSSGQKVVLEKYSQETFENTHLNVNQGLSRAAHGLFAEHLVKLLAIQNKKKKRGQVVIFLGVSLAHCPRTQRAGHHVLPVEIVACTESWRAGLWLGLRVTLHCSTAQPRDWLPTDPGSCSNLNCKGHSHCWIHSACPSALSEMHFVLYLCVL